MKRTLYILAIFAVLSGCSDQAPETPPAEQAAAPVEAPADASEEKPEPTVLFDILGIANKSEADVEAALGKPTETETGNWTLLPSEEKTPYVLHFYEIESGKVEALFIEGKAVRIEFYPKSTFKYPDDAIKAMRAAGLSVEDGAEPESEAPHFLDFGGIDGMYAVRVVKDLEGNPENIGYVKIVTEERYK
ncbi:hypothetical protein M4D58_17855 [Brevibacillus borstelensis]|uniref:hypothetical protein n=1 Tax=Brevibacillus borstelensis TaxID=45462 RepID=UPI00203E78CC|nr:hypothetical protein [Brevibacillus borstelensis]MCM3592488.1 hypothetical protein [Brevibacillus borstelensis]